MPDKRAPVTANIAPWLTFQNGDIAIDFYKAAFDAFETYRMESPEGGIVVKLSVNGAEFWISGSSAEKDIHKGETIGGENFRLILTVPNPDLLFAQALKAGATEVFPMGEEYGWRLGRIIDPFGLHWEIGHPL